MYTKLSEKKTTNKNAGNQNEVGTVTGLKPKWVQGLEVNFHKDFAQVQKLLT